MNPAEILIAVPTRGSIQWATVTRLQEIRDENPGLPPIVYQQGGVSVALTRNKIVARFLETDCKVLVMCDDDIAPPNDFLMAADSLGGYGILAVPQPMPMQQRPDIIMLSIYDRVEDGYRMAQELHRGPAEADAVGGGCIFILREVFERLGAAPFRMSHDPAADVGGEDFLFCEDVRESGYLVGYMFPNGHFCDHQPSVSLAPLFKGNLAQKQQPGMNRHARRQMAKAGR